jgi:hypothetical protein
MCPSETVFVLDGDVNGCGAEFRDPREERWLKPVEVLFVFGDEQDLLRLELAKGVDDREHRILVCNMPMSRDAVPLKPSEDRVETGARYLELAVDVRRPGMKEPGKRRCDHDDLWLTMIDEATQSIAKSVDATPAISHDEDSNGFGCFPEELVGGANGACVSWSVNGCWSSFMSVLGFRS